MAGWAQTSVVDRWPAVWRSDGTGFLLPGTALDVPGEVLSISADGKMVAGTWGFDAFYWTEGTGIVNGGANRTKTDSLPSTRLSSMGVIVIIAVAAPGGMVTEFERLR